MDRYRHKYLCFNDDIQGTGAVALAGILCSLRARGKTFKDLVNERILVVGAGSAGMGVANTILSYAEEMCGLTKDEARRLFWVTDNMVRRILPPPVPDAHIFTVNRICRVFCLRSA